MVDGSLELRFAVTTANEKEAKREAEKLINKLMETEVLGSAGWTFTLSQVKEVRPVKS